MAETNPDIGGPMQRSRLARNLFVLYGAEAMTKALGMVVFAFVGRQVGPQAYGAVEGAVAVWFIANLMLEAGLSDWGAREAARDPRGAAALAGRVSLLRSFNMLAATAVVAAVAFLVHPSGPTRLLCLGYIAVLIPSPFALAWVFQSRDEMGVVALGSLVRQIILAIVVFAFVRSASSAVALPIGDALGVVAMVAVHQIFFRRRVGVLKLAGSLEGSLGFAKDGYTMAASALAWALRLFAPLLLLSWLQPDRPDAGFFGAGHRLVVSVHTFVWLYFFNLLPSVTRAATGGDRGAWARILERSATWTAWMVIPLAWIGRELAPFFLRLVYSKDYDGGADAFGIMIGLLAAAFLSGHARYALIANGRPRGEFLANFVGAVVVIGACLLLGRSATPEQAAVVFVAGEVVALATALILVWTELSFGLFARSLGIPILALILAFGAYRGAEASGLPGNGAAAGAYALVFVLDRLGARRKSA